MKVWPSTTSPQITIIRNNPNATSRRGTAIDSIVVHNTGGTSLDRAVQHLTTPTADHITAHYVIGKDGTIDQITPDAERANHAAGTSDQLTPQVSGIQGHVNYRSIGIELVNRGNGNDDFPDAQQNALRALLLYLCEKYHISPDNIIRHDEVNGWHPDPNWNHNFEPANNLDWDGLKEYLERNLPIPLPGLDEVVPWVSTIDDGSGGLATFNPDQPQIGQLQGTPFPVLDGPSSLISGLPQVRETQDVSLPTDLGEETEGPSVPDDGQGRLANFSIGGTGGPDEAPAVVASAADEAALSLPDDGQAPMSTLEPSESGIWEPQANPNSSDNAMLPAMDAADESGAAASVPDDGQGGLASFEPSQSSFEQIAQVVPYGAGEIGQSQLTHWGFGTTNLFGAPPGFLQDNVGEAGLGQPLGALDGLSSLQPEQPTIGRALTGFAPDQPPFDQGQFNAFQSENSGPQQDNLVSFEPGGTGVAGKDIASFEPSQDAGGMVEADLDTGAGVEDAGAADGEGGGDAAGGGGE